jgi:hypothetical protein
MREGRCRLGQGWQRRRAAADGRWCGAARLVVVDIFVVDVVEGSSDAAPVVGLLAQLFVGIWAGDDVVGDVDKGKWPGLSGACACSAGLAFCGRTMLEGGAVKLYGAPAVDGMWDAEPTAPF